MKLEATCDNCSRRFALAQVLPEPEGTSGRCPFCGFRFGRHYVSVLPESVREAENALDQLLVTLGRLHGMRPGFTLDIESVIRRINEDATGARQDESV